MSRLNRVFLLLTWLLVVIGGSQYGYNEYDVGPPDSVSKKYLYLKLDVKKFPPRKVEAILEEHRHYIINLVSRIGGMEWALIWQSDYKKLKEAFEFAFLVSLERDAATSPLAHLKDTDPQAYRTLSWRMGSIRRNMNRLDDVWNNHRHDRRAHWRGKLNHLDRRKLYVTPGENIALESKFLRMFRAQYKPLPKTSYQLACEARNLWVVRWVFILSFLMFLARLLLQISDRRLYIRLNWPELILSIIPGYSLYNIAIGKNDPRERYLQRVRQRKLDERMSEKQLDAFIAQIQNQRAERRREVGHMIMQFKIAFGGLAFAVPTGAHAQKPVTPIPIPCKDHGSKQSKKKDKKKNGEDETDQVAACGKDQLGGTPKKDDTPANDTTKVQSKKSPPLRVGLSGFAQGIYNPERPNPDKQDETLPAKADFYIRSDLKLFPGRSALGVQLHIGFAPGILIGGVGITGGHKWPGLFIGGSLLLRGKIFLPVTQKGVVGTWDIQTQGVLVKQITSQHSFLFLMNMWWTGNAASAIGHDGVFKWSYIHLTRFTLFKHIIVGIDSDGSFNTRGDPGSYWQVGPAIGYKYKWLSFVAVLNIYTDTNGWWGLRPYMYVSYRL